MFELRLYYKQSLILLKNSKKKPLRFQKSFFYINIDKMKKN